jgi:hypothetical protein
LPHSPTAFRRRCRRQFRRHHRRNCPHACLTRVPSAHHRRHFRLITDGSKSLAGFSNFFGAHFN